jgi:methionyl aminopeptidase
MIIGGDKKYIIIYLFNSFVLPQVGITTDELDQVVHNKIVSEGAYPSPLLYKNFPKSVCTSVNNVVCHGIPDDRKLCDGDIVNVDVTVGEKTV